MNRAGAAWTAAAGPTLRSRLGRRRSDSLIPRAPQWYAIHYIYSEYRNPHNAMGLGVLHRHNQRCLLIVPWKADDLSRTPQCIFLCLHTF